MFLKKSKSERWIIITEKGENLFSLPVHRNMKLTLNSPPKREIEMKMMKVEEERLFFNDFPHNVTRAEGKLSRSPNKKVDVGKVICWKVSHNRSRYDRGNF